jgi:hypothetical protein
LAERSSPPPSFAGAVHPARHNRNHQTSCLTAGEFGIIAIVAIAAAIALRPEFLDRLQKFDFAGVKLELGEVRRGQLEVQKQQQEQAAMLEDIRLALRVSIGHNEQQHLLKIYERQTADYRVRGALRDELRRLRAMQLIRMRGSRTVGSMPCFVLLSGHWFTIRSR